MADPAEFDAQIRARLRQLEDDLEYGNERTVGILLAAVTAVLNVHKREHVNGYRGGKGWDHCASCRDTGWGAPEVHWPCETVEVIAKELGIEPADD